MSITYKYNIGDIVRFKKTFSCTCSCGLKELAGSTGVIEERRNYNGPTYKLAGDPAFYQESCFEGPALSKFFTQRDEASETVKDTATEETRDTEGSGEFEVLPLEEAKWYRISFSAKLTPDDLRAMKKCFFDAMNEAMEIYDLANFKIEEDL